MMVSFNVEDGRTVPEIVRCLAEQNYEESGVLQVFFNLNVKESLYVNNPDVRVYTMRDLEELIGYAVYFITEHPHFAGVKMAFNDVIYIKKEYRKIHAADFFMFCESNLDDGVQVIQHGMNYDQPHSKLMESLGYTPAEIMYSKVIS